MTVIIECISWLVNVTDNNDARWKPEIKCDIKFYLFIYLQFSLSLLFSSLSSFTNIYYT